MSGYGGRRSATDGPGECGVGDTGYGVPPDGSFELPCTRGGWTIIVQALETNGRVEVGRGHVVVPANGTGRVRIVLVAGAKLNG